jgi:hypothetical protein
MDRPPSDCLAHLNVENDREVAALAAALNCLPVDIFHAVAHVGGRIIDIGDYIYATFGEEHQHRRRCRSVDTTDDLPPTWPSADKSRRLH